jgi:hypothetical protein
MINATVPNLKATNKKVQKQFFQEYTETHVISTRLKFSTLDYPIKTVSRAGLPNL